MTAEEQIYAFIHERYEGADKKMESRLAGPLKRLLEVTDDLSIFQQVTTVDYIDIFQNFGWTARTTFNSNKSLIANFLDWLSYDSSEIRKLDYEAIDPNPRFASDFFKDADDFLDMLETVFAQDKEAMEVDTGRYIMEKAYYALYWEGFTKENILLAQQSDFILSGAIQANYPILGVLFNKMDSYCIKIRSETNGELNPQDVIQKLNNRIAKYIIDITTKYGFMNAVGDRKRYRRFARNKMLIRNTNKNYDKQDVSVPESTIVNYSNTLKKLTDKIPATNPFHGRKINTRNISKSRLYSDFHDQITSYINSNSIILTNANEHEKIVKDFFENGFDRTKGFENTTTNPLYYYRMPLDRFAKEYCEWHNTFYSDEKA